MKARKTVVCSFCGKGPNEDLHLISGQDGSSICTECVALCVEIHDHEKWALPGVQSMPTSTGQRFRPALGRLDASWRGEYIDEATKAERLVDTSGHATFPVVCVFCNAFSSADDDAALVVFRGVSANVVLNKYPYSSGHLLVLPTRHVDTLQGLEPDELSELWQLVTTCSTVIQRAYEPDGMNVGLNLGRAAGAGLPAHLHVHILPRWISDTNFMTTIGDARVIPEAIEVTLRRVKDAWLLP